MQQTSALRRSYYPTRYYFKERAPLRLKNHISSDYKRISGQGCLGEMTSLLGCLKDHEFENSPCGKEFEAFQKCLGMETTALNAIKSSVKRGTLTETENRDLGYKEINKIMAAWKQPSAAGKKHVLPRPPHLPYSDRGYPADRGRK